MSLSSTWKYAALEIPAVCLALKALDASRADVLATCEWRALSAFGDLPAAHTGSVEERTLRAAARLKGQSLQEASL